jgi:hypothetical protein
MASIRKEIFVRAPAEKVRGLPPIRDRAHYNAAAQVFSEQSGGSRFVRVVDLLPDELKDHVAQMMDQRPGTIKATMELPTAVHHKSSPI